MVFTIIFNYLDCEKILSLLFKILKLVDDKIIKSKKTFQQLLTAFESVDEKDGKLTKSLVTTAKSQILSKFHEQIEVAYERACTEGEKEVYR